jgi:hypothetical protein
MRFTKYNVEMTSSGMIYIPRSIKTGTGVQAILGFHLSNLRGSNTGITDEKDLWAQVA